MDRPDEQLHVILEATPIPLIISRVADGKILYSNEHLATMVGLAPEEVTGRVTVDFYADPQERALVLDRLRTDGYIRDHELRIKREDGQILWVMLSLVATQLGGEPVVVGGLYNITERVQADKALRESEALFRQLTENINEVFWMRDLKTGRMLFVSPAYERIFGCSCDDLRERPESMLEVVHPDDRERMHRHQAAALDHSFVEPLEEAFRIVRPDGTVRWVRTRVFPIRNSAGEIDRVCGVSEDFTEHRQADEALRESEALFRQLTENINEVFWMTDQKTGRILYVSPAYDRIYGRSRERLYGNQNYLQETIHPDDLDRVQRRISSSRTRPVTEYDEFRIVRPDGTMRWIRTRAFPVRDSAGEVYRMCGVDEDFTERKQITEALESERNFVSAVLDTAGALVVVLDPQGRIVRFNRACERITGYAFEEVRGKIFWDVFVMPEELARVREVFEALRTGNFPNAYENHWVTKEGARRLISWSNTALLDTEGAVEYIIGTGIDMTEHRQADEALRESEERFRNIVENANDILYSLTPDGVFTYVSPNWTDILGHEVSEVTGESFAPFVHPDDLPACLAFLSTVLETGERQSGVEYRVKHKDGSWRWHTSNASCLKDERGNVVSFIGIARDVTEKKIASEELRKANRELRETQAQLVQSEKMASLGNLVAGVAHEINTPVGAIHSMHDTLMRAVEKFRQTIEAEFPQEYRDNRALQSILKVISDANRVIATGTERVTEIVRSLRSFARLDEAEMKKADLHEGIENALTLVHHDLKNRINVVRHYGNIPPIVCYPGRLNQVFLNILVNAAHAIEGAGEITITTFVEGDRAHVAIRDTGVGIPKENLKEIFDPGFTTKGVGVGTGLGLSICYQIIRDHKGEIRVESQVGEGTTVTVVLPTDMKRERRT